MGWTFERATMRDDRETEITAEIEVSTWGSPGGYWEPPEGPECELIKAWTEDGAEVKLTDAEIERIEREFLEDPPEPDYDDD